MAVGMFGVGIVFIYLMPVLLTPLSLALLLMLLGLLCFVSKGFRLWGVWFALGLLWGWWTVSEQLSDRISSDIEGVDLVITGVVDDLVRHSKKRHLFTFTVLSSEAAPLPKRLRLSWYYPKKQLEAGEVWQLKVRLKQPNGFNNPGGFDYEGWLWTQGVGATGYVRAGDENQRLPENHWRSWYPQQRGGLYAQLAVATQNLPHAGFIRALAMGDKSSLMPEQKQVLQATGTSHLLAISGLHVGMVSMLVFLLVKWLWSRSVRLLSIVPAAQIAAVFSIIAAFSYAAIAGWSVPTQRAFLMIAIVMWFLFRRDYVPKRIILAWVFSLVLLVQPAAVISAGFWLSFVAVAVILWVSRNPSRWPAWVRVQWVVSIAMVPLTAFFFAQISLVSPLANFVMIPVFTFLVVPIVLLGVLSLPIPVLSDVCFAIADWVLSGVWWFLTELSQWSVVAVGEMSLSYFLLVMVGLVYWLLPVTVPLRHLALLPVGLVIFSGKPEVAFGEIKMAVLDVGQGLALVVQTMNHTLLYDAGAKYSEHLNAGAAVVLPYLRSEGVNALDLVMISHGDNDHKGGFASVVQGVTVASVLSGEPQRLQHPRAKRCQKGMRWQWDGVTFEVLSPGSFVHKKGNNQSCVLLVKSKAKSLLLMGDAEKKVERVLLQDHPELSADMVIVPHHGSKTSSSAQFVSTIKPELAIVSAGYRNRFGHPAAVIVDRYLALGTKVVNTARAGMILIESDEEDLHVSQYRLDNQHFWQRDSNKVF